MHLHLVSFDIPFPADYGGVIDVYYKLKSLAQVGVKVHLHCFGYGRKQSEELEKHCYTVTYYQRNTAKSQLFNRLPYIVVSRGNELLIQNLLNDNYPILFEGLHCCFYLDDARLKHRVRIVRTHNIEHHYYQSLARIETNIFKRYYFYNEAEKLATFEQNLRHATYIAAISPNDNMYFNKQYEHAQYVPAFHAHTQMLFKPGKGSYALYHGNLSIGENNEAALYLINEVFSKTTYHLVIAGSKPSKALRAAIDKHQNISLRADISVAQIETLIAEAHINVLPTFQPTGIKLKLLSALYLGRHCLVNDVMVSNTGLEPLCYVANNAQEFIVKLKQLFKKSFTQADCQKRTEILLQKFSNETGAQKLVAMINSYVYQA
ncbi:MAG: glycosyltransferase [Bacteroidia bacterium]|nr:glycosyltransferase [Bacteroidia bacterium]